LTVTEGGYHFHAVTRDSMQITWTCGRPGAGSGPEGGIRLITEALVRRRHRDLSPFTLVSRDHIQGNGDAARRSPGTVLFRLSRRLPLMHELCQDFLLSIPAGVYGNEITSPASPTRR
jgi:hypothetical protein